MSKIKVKCQVLGVRPALDWVLREKLQMRAFCEHVVDLQ